LVIQSHLAILTSTPKGSTADEDRADKDAGNYGERVEEIRGWLDPLKGFQQVGRNGLHRYNNSDHSMLTAMRAVENVCDGGEHDIWAVNADGAYLEEAEVDESIMRGRETDEGMIHDYQIVPIEILFDRGLSKFA